MKIALIYDAVYPWIKGGGEKTLYELACELRDRGHEPHLFGMHCWDGPADMVRHGLHYHALCPNVSLYSASGRRRLSQPLRFAWGVLWRLPRYRLHEFDLIDLHAFPILSVPPFWLVHTALARRVPWLLTWLEVWGGDYWRRYLGRLGRLGALVERLAARMAKAHLCISPTTARRLHALLGVREEDISVIPRGFKPPENLSIAPKRHPYKVVVAGRLQTYKRVDVLLRAWPRVVAHLPQARLHVIGDGPRLGDWRQLAVQLGVAETVVFRGQLPEREQVLEEIASADLLLQPSAREGQSTVVLEAMALDTPVLAARGPETAVADFLGSQHADSEAALLPLEAGPEQWAERITQMLADRPLLVRLAEQGRDQVARLRWNESIAPQVEALYLRLIRGDRARIDGGNRPDEGYRSEASGGVVSASGPSAFGWK